MLMCLLSSTFVSLTSCFFVCSGPHKHQSAVTCLQFNKNFVITSSDDGTVKLWDLKTGEFIRNLVTLESGGSGGVVWRIRASNTKLVCAVGSRNGTEETKLLVLDFDVDMKWEGTRWGRTKRANRGEEGIEREWEMRHPETGGPKPRTLHPNSQNLQPPPVTVGCPVLDHYLPRPPLGKCYRQSHRPSHVFSPCFWPPYHQYEVESEGIGLETRQGGPRPVCPLIGWEKEERKKRNDDWTLLKWLSTLSVRGQLRTETWFRSSLTDFEMYRDILFFKDPPSPPTHTPPPISARPHTHTLKNGQPGRIEEGGRHLKLNFTHTVTPEELLVVEERKWLEGSACNQARFLSLRFRSYCSPLGFSSLISLQYRTQTQLWISIRFWFIIWKGFLFCFFSFFPRGCQQQQIPVLESCSV